VAVIECDSWQHTSQVGLRVKCQRERGHLGNHWHVIEGPLGWTVEWAGHGEIPVARPSIIGSVRVIGLSMVDVLFLCEAESIPFPGRYGSRPSMVDERPRTWWNFTADESADSFKLTQVIRHHGFTVFHSKRAWEEPLERSRAAEHEAWMRRGAEG
jgi:hypothetical protein